MPAHAEDSPQLAFSVQIDTREAFVGERILYRVMVSNTGTEPASSVEFRHVRSGAETRGEPPAPANGSCAALEGPGFICVWDSIPAGATETAEARIEIGAPGTIEITDSLRHSNNESSISVASGQVRAYGPRINAWNAPATAEPPARFGAVLVTDPLRRRAVLFGGRNENTILGDSWLWDGVTWTDVTPSPSPPARSHAVAAFDPTSKTVILFGGRDAKGAMSDTWAWDGTTWTRKTPSRSPAARSAAGLAAAHSQLVLFGGELANGKLARDTWTWNGLDWTPRSVPNPPMPRRAMVFVGDATGDALMFGGCCAKGDALFDETWRWNGREWSSVWARPRPTGRADAAGALDGATGSVVFVGGTDPSGAITRNNYQWGDQRAWLHPGPGLREARTQASMAYLPSDTHPLGALVLFGGKGSGGEVLAATRTVLHKPAARGHLSTRGVRFETMLGWRPPAAEPVTISNLGSRPIDITPADWERPPSRPGSLEHNAHTCRGRLEAGESCTFQTWFRPVAPGWGGDVGGMLHLFGHDALGMVNLWASTYGAGPAGPRYGSARAGAKQAGGSSFEVWYIPALPNVVTDIQWARQIRDRSGRWVWGPWQDWKIGTRTQHATFGGSGQPRSVPGAAYLFRSRVRRGNDVSVWGSAPHATVVPYDDRSSNMRFFGLWSRTSVHNAFMGTITQATSNRSRMTVRAEGRRFTIIGGRQRNSGRFKLWVDGRYAGVVDTRTHLDAWWPGPRWELGVISFKKLGMHTITIVPEGTRGRPLVQIDGIAVGR